MNYIFEEGKFTNIARVIFLCGSAFSIGDSSDKRTVLKAFLESDNSINKAVILEQNFSLTPVKGKLAYDKIFLKNLLDIELLVALLADYVFIIHESLSTATEVGAFATNQEIIKKMCLIVPDKYNVQENMISRFMKLAFQNRGLYIPSITFYPTLKVNVVSKEISNYHTYFRKNTIQSTLGKRIKEILENQSSKGTYICYKKALYTFSDDYKTVSYRINQAKKVIMLGVPIRIFKLQLMSLFCISELTKPMTSNTELYKITKLVSYIQDCYQKISINTICEKEGLTTDEYSIKVQVLDSGKNLVSIRKSISLQLYLLQAIGFIKLPYNRNPIKIKMSFKDTFKPLSRLNSKLLESELSKGGLFNE